MLKDILIFVAGMIAGGGGLLVALIFAPGLDD